MRYSAIILFITILMLNTNYVNAEERLPFDCEEVDATLIKCSVRVDIAEISDIKLNRGNCPSPVISRNEKDKLKEFLEKQAQKNQSNVEKERIALQLAAGFSVAACSLQELFSSQYGNNSNQDSENLCEINRILILDTNNPIGRYKFGDAFGIVTLWCPNLLEIEIEANGEAYVFEK